MSEFIWTDKLVAEYTTWKSKNGSVWINENIAKFKEYILKQQSKNNQDWEILSVKNIQGQIIGWNETPFDLNDINTYKAISGWKIHSVKVLSSGEIFSVDDEVTYLPVKKFSWIIDNFFINEKNQILARSKNNKHVEVVDKDFGKAKPVLFTTEQQSEIKSIIEEYLKCK